MKIPHGTISFRENFSLEKKSQPKQSTGFFSSYMKPPLDPEIGNAVQRFSFKEIIENFSSS